MPHGVCPELVAEQGISGLCARSFHSSLPFSASVARMIFARLDRLFRPRFVELPRAVSRHVRAVRGGYGGDHLGVPEHGGREQRPGRWWIIDDVEDDEAG